MKLHLPLSLFRSLLALCAAGSSVLYAAYTVPASVSTPSGYKTIWVDELSDMTTYSANAANVAFRISENVKINKYDKPLMSDKSGSWYFSCNNVSKLTDLVFYKSENCPFTVGEDKKLEFTALKSLNFDQCEYFSSKQYNTLIVGGGVISGGDDSQILLNKIKNVVFSENTLTGNIVTIQSTIQDSAESRGGAIHAGRDSNIKLNNNDTVLFSENVVTAEASSDIGRPLALAYGGAISGNVINLISNNKVSFVNNEAVAADSAEAYAYGGAISGNSITINYNGEVEFIENALTSNPSRHYAGTVAVSEGSAIYTGDDGVITILGNGSVLFEANRGASVIQAGADSSFLMSNNKSVTFTQNAADSINMGADSSLTIRDNDTVIMEDLMVGAGSTVLIQKNKSLTFTGLNRGNNEGSVSILNNTSITHTPETQGWIQGKTLTLSGNSSMIWAGNLESEEVMTIQKNGILEVGNLTTQGDLVVSSNTSLSANDLRGGKARFASNQSLSLGSVNAASIQMSGNTSVTVDGTMTAGAGGAQVINNSTLVLDSVSSGATTNISNNSSLTVNDVGGTVVTISGNKKAILNNTVSGTKTSISDNGSISGNVSLRGTESLTVKNNGAITISSLFSSGAFNVADNAGLSLHYATSNLIGGLLHIRNCATLNFHGYIGEAVTAASDSFVELFGNSQVLFYTSNENARAVTGSTVTLKDNKSVSFSSHKHDDYAIYGGAVYTKKNFTLLNNGTVKFEKNECSNTYTGSYIYGAAIYGVASVDILSNQSVSFRDNSASMGKDVYGGAIYGQDVTMRGNNTLLFSANSAAAYRTDSYYDSSSTYARGGAIYAPTSLKIENNGAVIFSENLLKTDFARDSYRYYYSSYAYGGAIYGGSVTLNNNTSLTFRGNRVDSQTANSTPYAKGGAIYANTLTLQNNGSVLFEKNMQTEGSANCLRSVHVTSNASLSAAAGKKIEFRDSLYVEGSLVLNGNYITSSGSSLKQTGDIVFTGAYTEAHLKSLKGEDGTTTEIANSRTSAVAGTTTLNGGRLIVEKGAGLGGGAFEAAAGSSSTVILNDGSFMRGGSNITFNSGTTLDLRGNNTMAGYLNLNAGSSLRLNLTEKNEVDSPQVFDSNKAILNFSSGSCTMASGSRLVIPDGSVPKNGTWYLLMSGVSKSSWGNASTDYFSMPIYTDREDTRLSWNSSNLYFYYEVISDEWDNYNRNGLWDKVTTNWLNNDTYRYRDSGFVTFSDVGAGAVSLVGTLKPYEVTVMNSKGKDYVWQGSGKLAGTMKLYKKGAGTLTIKNTNDFTGGTYISGGRVVLEANNALGSGPIQISGGASLSSSGSVYAKSLTLSGNAQFYAKGSVAKAVTLTGNLESTGSKVTMFGTLKLDNLTLKNSTMSNNGSSAVNIAMKNRAYLSASSLTLGGTLSGTNLIMSGSQLTQSGSATGLSMSGKIAVGSKSTLTTAGTITGTNLAVTGNSTLNAKNATARSITLTGNLEGTKATMNMYGNVKANNLALKLATLTNSGTNYCTFNIGNRAYLTDTTMTQKGDMTARNMTLSNSKLTHTGSKLALGEKLALGSKSTLNSNAALSAINVILTGGSTLNVQNAAAKDVSVSSNLQVTDSTLKMHGNLNAGNLVVQNGSFLGNGKTAKSYVVRNKATLSNAKLDINGYLNAKAATLSGSHLKQYGHANGVKITGQLTMFNNSTITTSGTLSAGAMTLTGGTINLTSDTLKAINVTNAFTLNKAIDLNLGCTNLVKGKDYKLITFKTTNLTKSSNLVSLLGMSGSGATLTLNSSNIAIRVTNTTAWNKYLTASKNAFSSTTMAMLPETEEEAAAEGEMAEEIVTTSQSETTEAVASFDRSGADALVQSNWGMLNATRAFTDTIGNRAANRRALGEEQKSAVWMSAMGASTRLSSDGEAAGSDYNLYGAAFGMEQKLTGKSSLGLAIGESRGKVSSFTATRTKQDTLHTALYGQHLLQQSTSDALTLDWSAAYGRTESKWQGTEWEQKSVQLDARATWAHQLNARTTVSGFAGMQYYASETGDVAPGIESGSIRNLRGEIGAGIGHRATSKTSIYGELSFVGDMVRHNPTASIGEQREGGANPGRVGLNLSAGVNHALNEKWSVNASYNLELQERANSHSANIGAGYKF